MCLDLGDLRVVYAAWHPTSMDALCGYLNHDLTLRKGALEPMSRNTHTSQHPVQMVTLKMPHPSS